MRCAVDSSYARSRKYPNGLRGRQGRESPRREGRREGRRRVASSRLRRLEGKVAARRRGSGTSFGKAAALGDRQRLPEARGRAERPGTSRREFVRRFLSRRKRATSLGGPAVVPPVADRPGVGCPDTLPPPTGSLQRAPRPRTRTPSPRDARRTSPARRRCDDGDPTAHDNGDKTAATKKMSPGGPQPSLGPLPGPGVGSGPETATRRLEGAVWGLRDPVGAEAPGIREGGPACRCRRSLDAARGAPRAQLRRLSQGLPPSPRPLFHVKHSTEAGDSSDPDSRNP